MKLTPSLEEFKNKAQTANMVPLSMPISTDLDTPVSMYYKLVGEEKGFLLESVDAHQKFGRFSFIGADPFIKLQVYKNRLMIQEEDEMKAVDGDPVTAINKYMDGLKSAMGDQELPLANGGAVGYFNYEISAVFDRVRNLQVADEELLGQFMICRILMVFDQQKNASQLIYLASVKDGQNLDEVYEDAQQKMMELADKLYATVQTPAVKSVQRREKVDFLAKYGKMPADFAETIKKCKDYIVAGDIFQVVPSRQFREKLTKPAFHFYRRLRQVNPSPYMFYLNFGKKKFVAASPEMLVKVAGKHVYTYPIAGTRRRGGSEEEDKALEAELKADIKECAEHSMLVDLARNDIGRISEPGSVVVTKLREVERFSHVMHMVSEVMGSLKKGFTPMDVIKACFPAGTVSGAPKLRAMEIIQELEPVKRGAYSGTVGYMDFNGNMDMCITLRTMVIDGDNAYIQSGAGIVYDSKADFEYNEILQKSKAMFKVVEEVENDVVAFR
ncbi:Anthranilate synthase, aminase component [Anaerovibrio sp. JC8]|uniref:anthranilate synthase component I n=1 Tax=Anaerovibrio sp. JC8 TaxID=1240085 RepID=UPI000A0B6607|nr:anthranilate synthase component I [Anaerovibrio sp. JC8]ORU00774.1 Anthranilate synthase, aminase component [Anaerovibrio sp. JC8]